MVLSWTKLSPSSLSPLQATIICVLASLSLAGPAFAVEATVEFVNDTTIDFSNQESVDSHQPILIAHRGGVVSDDSPECSTTAIMLARTEGYDMVELDVQVSSDGVPILFHDKTLENACGKPGRVEDYTAQELTSFKLKGYSERIERLDTALHQCQIAKLGVMLDLKTGQDSTEFLEEINRLIAKYGFEDSTLSISGSPTARRVLKGVRFTPTDDEMRRLRSGENVSLANRFWFGIPSRLQSGDIAKLKAAGALVIPAINAFRYPADRHFELAMRDVLWLTQSGVHGYQIDSVYGSIFAFGKIAGSSQNSDQRSRSTHLRVLAYNIKHGRGNDGLVDLERTAAVIRRLQPSVVALQEVDNGVARSGNIDEAKRLAELTGLNHHAFGSFFDYQGGEYGMAILSRYPLRNVTNLRLPGGAEPRTALIATVAAPNPFRLVSVHFYQTEEERLAQSQTLLDHLDETPDLPCIIAGDFNSRPDSPVLKLFADWHVPDKGKDHFTFSSDKPKSEIDFIMFRPDPAFISQGIDVVDEPIASDHRPLTLDLSVLPTSPDRWFKGNLHTHSLWSDGNDFPEMIADWYRQHGYQFLALSDHNILSEGEKWMKLTDIESRKAKDALPKYLERFGKDWVETRGNRSEGTFEVRLKPLSEFRTLVESNGRFLMIQSEEITDSGVHINATNIGEVIEPQGGDSIQDKIRNNLRAVDAQAKRLGRVIIPHLNHPNLGDSGISAEELAALVQDEYFEVFNGVDQDGDLGSDRRHSLETLWDITSTLRISKFRASPMFGLATDDSHQYHGQKRLSPGRGWIMLRAKHLSPESIVNAMKRGDFYASSGVELNTVSFDTATKTLNIEIEPDGDAVFETRFIGTPIEFDHSTTQRVDKDGKPVEGTLDYSDDVGKVFATKTGLSVSYQLTGKELYVRATITSNKAPDNPSSESPLKKAWTQPFGWRSQLTTTEARSNDQ